MKKYLSISTFITSLCVPIGSVLAVAPTAIELVNPSKFDSVATILKAFFEILVQLGAVAVTLAIVYAGFLFVMARGNPEQLNKAKMTLFWTIIGGLVLLGAQVIANIIQNTVEKL